MSADTPSIPKQVPTSDGTSESRRSPLRDFLRGAALIFDFGGTIGPSQISTVRNPSDADRLAADWDAIGQDLRQAMGNHPSQRPLK